MSSTLLTLTLDDQALGQICTSDTWIQSMKTHMPFESAQDFHQAAKTSFEQLEEQDWLEAFAGHPMIGDLTSLQKKYAQGKALSEKEQSEVQHATHETLQELLSLNQAYLKKFGFIFIVCATNKNADEMLTLLKARFPRTRAEELQQAAIEQQKISQIRMEAYL